MWHQAAGDCVPAYSILTWQNCLAENKRKNQQRVGIFSNIHKKQIILLVWDELKCSFFGPLKPRRSLCFVLDFMHHCSMAIKLNVNWMISITFNCFLETHWLVFWNLIIPRFFFIIFFFTFSEIIMCLWYFCA